MDRKVTVTGANILFLVFAVLFIVYQVVFVIVMGADFLSNNIYLILLINEFVIILVPVLIYAFKKKVNFRETFRFNKPGLLPVIIILLMSFPAYTVALMLNNIVAFFLQFIGKIPTESIPVPQNITQLIIGLLVVAVAPGICEEMLHRGIILKAYEKRGSIKAVVITSIFFGFFHFDITNLLGPIFLGLLIGYYVIRTNSIFAGMLAHFFNNAIAELWQYFTRDQKSPEFLSVSIQELAYIIAIGIIGLVITGLLFLLFRKLTEGKSVIIPPISSIKKDITSIISHWPIIIVLVLYFLFIVIFLLSILLIKFSN